MDILEENLPLNTMRMDFLEKLSQQLGQGETLKLFTGLIWLHMKVAMLTDSARSHQVELHK